MQVEVLGQAGLRQSLERLDVNKNGYVDPHEITPLARPYIEKISRGPSSSSSLDLSAPLRIDRLQDYARRYYMNVNGADRRREIAPKSDNTVLPFGPQQNEAYVPEFGVGEVKIPYTQDDVDFAARTMRSHDENKDGYIDRREAARHDWTHRNPFIDDLNQDDRISRMELVLRYARRRQLDDTNDQQQQVRKWTTSQRKAIARQQERDASRNRYSEQAAWRQGGAESWLAAGILKRFDKNEDGSIDQKESEGMQVPIHLIDVDRNQSISRDELFAYVLARQDATASLSEDVPEWFFELDVNDDRQVEMTEFTSEWTELKISEFASLDANQDGLLTADEVIRSSRSSIGQTFSNPNVELLPAGRTILSEIDVTEPIEIGDLDVRVSITHTYTGYLDIYLTGPDGQRIELCSGVGSNDDHFDETLFDDQAETPIQKGRPPFKGSFQPEALANETPSLGHFNGKSAQGIWQLTIRGARSDRSGLLHGWSLHVKSAAEAAAEAMAAAAEAKEKAEAEAKEKAESENSEQTKQAVKAPMATFRLAP